MRLDLKAALMLSAMFMVGAAAGAFGVGALRQRDVAADVRESQDAPTPDAARNAMRRDGSPRDSRFVSELERFLAPRDATQRARLRPHLLAADSVNSRYVQTARDSMSVVMRRLRDDIAPLLDSAQLARLDAWVAQPWEDRRQRRGGRDSSGSPREPRARDGAPKPPGDPLRKPNG
jgi:hypothetical protein